LKRGIVSPKEVPRYCKASGGLSPRVSNRGGRADLGAMVSLWRAAELAEPPLVDGVSGRVLGPLPLVLVW